MESNQSVKNVGQSTIQIMWLLNKEKDGVSILVHSGASGQHVSLSLSLKEVSLNQHYTQDRQMNSALNKVTTDSIHKENYHCYSKQILIKYIIC